MTTPRLWPTVQTLGRTIVCNRSDILQQSVRAYNNHNVQFGHANFNGHSLHHPSFEEKLKFNQSLFRKGRGAYLKVVSKNLSSGVQLFCREFTDGENEHAHDILRSLPAYEATTVDTKSFSLNFIDTLSMFVFRDKYWPSVGTDELVHSFHCISNISSLCSLTLEDQQYHGLCVSLMERIPFMSDDQLLKVLKALSHWPSSQSMSNNYAPKFDMLWKALDESCFKRHCRWNISKNFLVADHWYALRISKISMYFTRLLRNLGANILKMTPTQLVQYMFYVNLNRNTGAMKKRHLEIKLKEALKCISIEELGIIAMALFKSQVSILNLELIDQIIKATVNNLECISDHSLVSILKLLNKSLPGNGHSQCYAFLETLNPHLNKFNNFVFLQAAIFGNNLLVFHKDVMSKIGVRFSKEITELRLKDLERFTYSLMLYKFIPPDCPHILDMIIKELRKPERVVEINHFPRSFIACVNYLVAMGVFPHDLISAALQPSMVQLLRLNSSELFGREVNELNWSLKIEVPSNYLGYALNHQQSDALTKRFMGRIPSSSKGLNYQERLLMDIEVKLSAMMDTDDCVEPTFILPHFFNPDLVFCTTCAGEPVKLPVEYKRLPMDALKRVKDFEHLGLLWNAVIIAGRNSIIRETNELRGNLEMKKRQLTKLGYKVSVVPFTGYVKTKMKFKLMWLEKNLKETSSLNLEGRTELALNILKSESKVPFDVVVIDECAMDNVMEK